jgi:hypothetical protein
VQEDRDRERVGRRRRRGRNERRREIGVKSMGHDLCTRSWYGTADRGLI